MTRGGTVCILNKGHVSVDLLDWVRTLPADVVLEKPQCGPQIPRGRNLGAAKSLQGPWVLFVDSDVIPSAFDLPRLLSRDKPLIGGVCCRRFPPWDLTAVKDGWTGPQDIERVRLATLPRSGVIKVSAVGTGFLLVRSSVLEAIRFPWFKCGQIRQDLLLEDTGFCLEAARAGIATYLDCEVRVGHDFGGGIVTPGRDGRPWIYWTGGTVEPVGESPAASPTSDLVAVGQ
jgi:hypothetical protein